MMILLPLLVGGSPQRAQPNDPRLEDCPFPADPNLVVGKLLACVRVELGQPMIHTRTWHDPDGDPAQVKILKAPPGVRIVNRPRTGSYTILWTPTRIQTCAIVVQVTDQPTHGRPKSDTGTILIQVVPRGQHRAPQRETSPLGSRPAPRGCGGPPQ
jgi:hypothetical protein